jgi:hypothetical protein
MKDGPFLRDGFATNEMMSASSTSVPSKKTSIPVLKPL